ncbi:MAG: RNA 2',3'-cyclic phosphodiesterase [FCB group bacterium]|jgi:2'-5' RNA ligase
MNTKRLFIGTFLDTEIMREHYQLIIEDFKPVSHGKWSEFENLHFTYKFLGDVSEEEIPKIENSFVNYFRNYDSVLTAQGLGVFPNIHNPRILFVNILNDDGVIMKIHKELSKVLLTLGFQPEVNQFTPHVTLQRIKSVNKFEFKKILEVYKSTLFGSMQKFSIHLIESKLTPDGPIYTILSE